MSAHPTAPSHPDQDAPAERNTVLLLVIGGLAAISVVVAALVIFSGGETPAEEPEAAAAVAAVDQSLVVGSNDAPTKIVVYEDFASPESRAFEIASRDFLRIEAARGSAQVEYRPFAAAEDGYSAEAMRAWVGVLVAGTPKQALLFHDVLFDRQPAAGSPTPSELADWAEEKGIDGKAVLSAVASPAGDAVTSAGRAAREAGVERTPYVLLDDNPVTAASPIELADELQRQVLERER